MTGTVYCIGEKPGGPVKVGFTTQLARRLADIQTGSPVPLVVLGSFAGTRGSEADLHEQFADLALHGEWFDDRALTISKWFADQISAGDTPRSAHPLKGWLREHGVSQMAFAAHVGTTQGHLSRMMLGKSQPSIDTAWAIECATGGAVPMQSWMAGQTARFPIEKALS